MSMAEVTELGKEHIEDVGFFNELLRIDKEIFGHAAWGADGFKDSVQNSYDRIFAATEKDNAGGASKKLLGFGIVRILDDGEIILIGVDAPYRQQGAGRMLLETLVSTAAGQGAGAVFLEVRRSNEAAVSMYEKAGFVTERIRKAYYTQPAEDAVIMRKLC